MIIEVILFKAEWCGHCTQFIDTWQTLQKNIKNPNIKFTTYEQTNKKHKEEFTTYNVTGFPTIKIKIGETVTEYTGDRSLEDLTQFISKQHGGSAAISHNSAYKYRKYKKKYLSLKLQL